MSAVTAVCLLCERTAPRRFTVGAYGIHRCNACDLEFAHPRPDEATRAAMYARGYFAGDGTHGYRDYFGAERAVADAKARERVALIAAQGIAVGSRWLDVGCADGRFVAEASARGFDAHGIEPSDEAHDAMEPGVRARVKRELETARNDGPFDVVTLWDVLEHVDDPIATLRALRACTHPRAVYGLVVPVIENANARWAPRTWDQYKPPEHLWYFSRASLRAVLRRALGAEVFVEKCAWDRGARVLDVALETRARWTRGAARLEGAMWAAMRRARVVDERATCDSVLVLAREPNR